MATPSSNRPKESLPCHGVQSRPKPQNVQDSKRPTPRHAVTNFTGALAPSDIASPPLSPTISPLKDEPFQMMNEWYRSGEFPSPLYVYPAGYWPLEGPNPELPLQPEQAARIISNRARGDYTPKYTLNPQSGCWEESQQTAAKGSELLKNVAYRTPPLGPPPLYKKPTKTNEPGFLRSRILGAGKKDPDRPQVSTRSPTKRLDDWLDLHVFDPPGGYPNTDPYLGLDYDPPWGRGTKGGKAPQGGAKTDQLKGESDVKLIANKASTTKLTASTTTTEKTKGSTAQKETPGLSNKTYLSDVYTGWVEDNTGQVTLFSRPPTPINVSEASKPMEIMNEKKLGKCNTIALNDEANPIRLRKGWVDIQSPAQPQSPASIQSPVLTRRLKDTNPSPQSAAPQLAFYIEPSKNILAPKPVRCLQPASISRLTQNAETQTSRPRHKFALGLRGRDAANASTVPAKKDENTDDWEDLGVCSEDKDWEMVHNSMVNGKP